MPVSYFNQQARLYAKFRPDYPPELFEFIALISPHHNLAWDCATGSGQAAIGLAKHFKHVVAIDTSPEQIAHARQHDRVEYRVATAEASGLENHSADVVMIAQALHWLDHGRFYAEVRRVVVPGGTIVATVYCDPTVNDPELDGILQNYNKGVVGPYWPPERKFVDEHYQSIPFPFEKITPPKIELKRDWNLHELAGYLRSWSATVRYQKANNVDPVLDFEEKMRSRWAEPGQRRVVRWPFTIFAGRVQ